MDKVSFKILGEPFGKQRPKFTAVGKFGRAYTPDKTVNYETYVKLTYNSLDLPKLEGQIAFGVSAYYPIPKSTSQKKRNLMLSGAIRPTIKPDYDNIAKIISDALNGIAYDDDKQIVDARIKKFYSEIPRVEVEISKVSNVGMLGGM